MNRITLIALAGALVLHGGLVLFGGLLFPKQTDAALVREDVELIAAAEEAKPDKEEQKEEEQAEEPVESDDEVLSVEAPPLPELRETNEAAPSPPALEALSLADLASVLNPGMGSGAFAAGVSLRSGGRIGGTGSLDGEDALESILSIADLDRRPRPIMQSMPSYPLELRKRRLEGTVHIVFLVDQAGQVQSPKVERSTDPAFERPAMEAVRRWKFEAGTKNGQKVQFKMRVPITFRAT